MDLHTRESESLNAPSQVLRDNDVPIIHGTIEVFLAHSAKVGQQWRHWHRSRSALTACVGMVIGLAQIDAAHQASRADAEKKPLVRFKFAIGVCAFSPHKRGMLEPGLNLLAQEVKPRVGRPEGNVAVPSHEAIVHDLGMPSEGISGDEVPSRSHAIAPNIEEDVAEIFHNLDLLQRSLTISAEPRRTRDSSSTVGSSALLGGLLAGDRADTSYLPANATLQSSVRLIHRSVEVLDQLRRTRIPKR